MLFNFSAKGSAFKSARKLAMLFAKPSKASSPDNAKTSPAGGEVPWLVLTAMFLAQSFARTGLGKRIAYTFVSLFGAHPLGLAYSLVFRCNPSFVTIQRPLKTQP